MKKILLTGGAGYIGSHIAVALAEGGYEPVLVDNFTNSRRDIPGRIEQVLGRKVKWYMCDCRNLEGLREIVVNEGGIHGIIHLAAFKAVGESVQNPLKYYRNNLDCMVTILDLMSKEKITQLVFSSSCTVYGSTDQVELDESSPIVEAQSPYGYTKQVCERMIRDMAQVSENWQTVSLRYFNPIGAHPSGGIGELPLGVPNNLVPYITQAAAGLRERLIVFGDNYDTHDGTCIRDYVHVMDIAEAHVKALDYIRTPDASRHDVFNLGMGNGISVFELIRLFEEVNQCKVPHTTGPRRPGDAPAVFAKVEKAAKTLHWKARYSIGEALQHAWKWQQNLK